MSPSPAREGSSPPGCASLRGVAGFVAVAAFEHPRTLDIRLARVSPLRAAEAERPKPSADQPIVLPPFRNSNCSLNED